MSGSRPALRRPLYMNFTHVIVPLDGSESSQRALPFAASVASRAGADIVLASVVTDEWLSEDRYALLQRLAKSLPVPASVWVRTIDMGSTSGRIAELEASLPKPLVCMSSYGHGHAGAIVASVAEGVLRAIGSPMLVVGPRCVRTELRAGGNAVVAVDGSETTGRVLDAASPWISSFDLKPWVVTSVEPGRSHDEQQGISRDDGDIVHSAARRLGDAVDRVAQWQVLSDYIPAKAIVQFAEDNDADMIVIGSHIYTGLRRLTLGSVSGSTIHRAPCPVLVTGIT